MPISPITNLQELHDALKRLTIAYSEVHLAYTAQMMDTANHALEQLRRPLTNYYRMPDAFNSQILSALMNELVAKSNQFRWTEAYLEGRREFVKGCIDRLRDMAMPLGIFVSHPSIYSRQADVSERWKKQEAFIQDTLNITYQLGNLIAECKDLPQPQANGPAPAQPDAQGKSESAPSGYLGGNDLTDALGIHPLRRSAFLKQLERKRDTLRDGDWQEVDNPRANCPKFQYRVDAPSVQRLAADYKTSNGCQLDT